MLPRSKKPKGPIISARNEQQEIQRITEKMIENANMNGQIRNGNPEALPGTLQPDVILEDTTV